MAFTRWLSDRLGLDPRPASKRPAGTRRVRTRTGLRFESLEGRRMLTTLTVLNNLDSGAGSLRAEISAAKSNDTIVFAPSLVGQTITLTKGELLINKNLTIAGPAPAN